MSIPFPYYSPLLLPLVVITGGHNHTCCCLSSLPIYCFLLHQKSGADM